MLNFRTLTRRWLPQNLKKSFQQLLLGYDSYAPSFSSAGEDMMLRHLLGSDKMSGFYVDSRRVSPDARLDPRESAIVRTMKTHGYELCAQNVIILGKINEYFLIDRTTG